MNNKKIIVACFGEVLWDLFPGKEKKAGGAPFNVAYNLSRLGIDARMISAIGDDELGNDLLNKIKNWNIPVDTIQINSSYPTSTVIAKFDENNEAHYDITANVAWDQIKLEANAIELVEKADAFVFGSLVTRENTSKDTLFKLLEKSNYNVFDINLRKPHYNIETIKDLLMHSHVAKFNKAELRLLLDSLSKEYKSEEDSINFLQEKFNLDEIIISKGSKGAIYGSKNGTNFYPAINIDVADTVGSGDSFLAGFLSKRLISSNTEEQTLNQAIALGAYITSQEGACPEYTVEEFEEFKQKHFLL